MTSTQNMLPKGRVVSIDALRGFDMFWIIGGGYFFQKLFLYFNNPFTRAIEQQLHHVKWNGFHFEDLIFPLFVFISGLSIPLAMKKRIDRGDSQKSILINIAKRTITLYFLGLVYYGFFDLNFGELRYVGVLQRIALCYFSASLIVLYFGIKGQAVWAGSLLVFYWIVMACVPVPGFGAGNFTFEGNLVGYIDRILVPGLLLNKTFDPEGILSTLPAISTALIGVLCGYWLKSTTTENRKVAGLLTAGVASLLLGLIWGIVFPINKSLWTSSFVLFSGGWSILLLTLFYWAIDVRGFRKWALPFVFIGLNAVTIYVATRFIDFGGIADIFIHGFKDKLGSFEPVFTAFSDLTVTWLFVYFLYRHRIFLKA